MLGCFVQSFRALKTKLKIIVTTRNARSHAFQFNEDEKKKITETKRNENKCGIWIAVYLTIAHCSLKLIQYIYNNKYFITMKMRITKTKQQQIKINIKDFSLEL